MTFWTRTVFEGRRLGPPAVLGPAPPNPTCGLDLCLVRSGRSVTSLSTRRPMSTRSRVPGAPLRHRATVTAWTLAPVGRAASLRVYSL